MRNLQKKLVFLSLIVALLMIVGGSIYAGSTSTVNQSAGSKVSDKTQDIFTREAANHISFGDSKELTTLKSMKCNKSDVEKFTQKQKDLSKDVISRATPRLKQYEKGMSNSRSDFKKIKAEILSLEPKFKNNQVAYGYLYTAVTSLNIGGDNLTDKENIAVQMNRMLPCIGVDNGFYKIFQDLIPPITKETAGREDLIYGIEEIRSAAHSVSEAKKYFSGEKSVEKEQQKAAQNLISPDDPTVIGYLRYIQASDEAYYILKPNSYSGFCNGREVSSINTQYPRLKLSCKDSVKAYAVSAVLSKGFYCVDSTGYEGKTKASNVGTACVH